MNELQQEDFDAAIKSFKAAKVCNDIPAANDVDDKIVEAQNGFILAITKARDEAIKAKEDAEKARDEAIAARKELEALTYISNGQDKELKELFKEAIEWYSKAIVIFPDSMSYYEKRAPLFMHDKIKEFEKAITDYNLLIKKGDKSKQAEYHDKLAYAYEQTKQFEQANKNLELAVATAGSDSKDIYEQKLDWADTRQQAIVNEEKPELLDVPVQISIVNKNSRCSLEGLSLKIGNNSFRLRGQSFKINKILPGTYSYVIVGNANCNLGRYKVHGKGTIKVVANSIYYLNVQIKSSSHPLFGTGNVKAYLRAY